MSKTPKKSLPQEFEGVTKDSIDRLDEKIDRCYSEDRYKDFQDAVEVIADKYIGTDGGRDKIKRHAREAAKDYIEEQGWRNMTFWIPTGVAVIAAIAAVATVVIALNN